MTSARAVAVGARSRHDVTIWRLTRRGSSAAGAGVVVAAVPWARHDAWFTRSFDDQAAWLAVNTSKSAICQLMRIAWRTVEDIYCERITAEAERSHEDIFANLEQSSSMRSRSARVRST